MPEGVRGAGWREAMRENNQDNCYSIINKIQFKKIKRKGTREAPKR